MNQNIVVLVNKGQPRNTRFVFRGCSVFYLVVCPEALRYQPFPNYENVQGILYPVLSSVMISFTISDDKLYRQ